MCAETAEQLAVTCLPECVLQLNKKEATSDDSLSVLPSVNRFAFFFPLIHKQNKSRETPTSAEGELVLLHQGFLKIGNVSF